MRTYTTTGGIVVNLAVLPVLGLVQVTGLGGDSPVVAVAVVASAALVVVGGHAEGLQSAHRPFNQATNG